MANPNDETKSSYNPNMKGGSEQQKQSSDVNESDAKKDKDAGFNQKK